MQDKVFPSTFLQSVIIILITLIISSPIVFLEKYFLQFLSEEFFMLISYTFVFFVLISLCYFINFKRNISINIKYKLNNIRLIPLMTLFLITFIIGIDLPIHKLIGNLNTNTLVPVNPFFPLIVTFGALFLAPLLEEIFFRGYVLNGFLSSYSPVKAIFLSAILFGIFHGKPNLIPGAIFLGLIFGYVYYKTNSLGMIILLHFMSNVFGILSSFLNFKLGKPGLQNVNDLYGNITIILLLVAVTLFGASSYYLYKKMKLIKIV